MVAQAAEEVKQDQQVPSSNPARMSLHFKIFKVFNWIFMTNDHGTRALIVEFKGVIQLEEKKDHGLVIGPLTNWKFLVFEYFGIQMVTVFEKMKNANSASSKKSQKGWNFDKNFKNGKLNEWIDSTIDSTPNLRRFTDKMPTTVGIQNPTIRNPESFEIWTFLRSFFEWFEFQMFGTMVPTIWNLTIWKPKFLVSLHHFISKEKLNS